ncbi:hypothetical protein Ami103574_01335 [Aminipila butyrica]|uniref:Uncharacterized protein n=1 Tax=Aminipila butyrica TaxID=433296 RepID=A0A858BRU1_9FIRM|nr:spore cortex biosynthesis protein YabQ [Aminipila butyrica]QIB68032.1 hypothetical protein Ami103574_01335 [Aminipila butyrica]
MVVSSGSAILPHFQLNMQLTDLVRAQLFECGVMLGCGMVVALLYGLFNRNLKVFIKKQVVAAIYEVLFWVFAGILTCQFLYYCAYGAISIHVICAFACGVFLWNLLFYATISMGDGKCSNERKKEAGSSGTPRK